jgi:hypothetical protein
MQYLSISELMAIVREAKVLLLAKILRYVKWQIQGISRIMPIQPNKAPSLVPALLLALHIDSLAYSIPMP